MNINDLIASLTSSGFHPLFGAEIIIATCLTIWMYLLLRKNTIFLKLSVVYINLLTLASIALGVYSCSYSASWAIITVLLWGYFWGTIGFLKPYPYVFKCSLLVDLVIYPALEYYLIETLTFYSGLVVGLMIFSYIIDTLSQIKHPIIIPSFLKLTTGIEESYFFIVIIFYSDANFLLRLFAFFAWMLRPILWKISYQPLAIFGVVIFPAAAWLVHSDHLVYYVQLFVSLELIVFFIGSDWNARFVADA
ncbi:MAG: hypothetical protein ABL884_05485 [Methyloglobulus sp.]